MKILNLRLQNLNSLTGVCHIDFTDPCYRENSLFAITGPTGAGKSTILDGLCLALYGRTPRLSRISKAGNEIMSRHSGICFAEVEFETVRGRFRCHWSQHRSRQKATGDLQQAKHEIANAMDSTILESRIRDVTRKVEEVTGMDFDRFIRSTLLAQGGFAAFLEASPNERAPILEQITGTEIYSRLSIKVHERRAEEERELDQLQKDLSHIKLLSEREAKALQELILNKDGESGHLKASIAKLRTQHNWLTKLAELSDQLQSCLRQQDELTAAEEDLRPQLDKLQPGLDALKIEPLYKQQRDFLAASNKKQAEIKKLGGKISSLREEQKQSEQAEKTAGDLLQQSEKRQTETLLLIREVQELDHSIKSTREGFNKETEQLAREKRKEKEEKDVVEELRAKQALAEKKKDALLYFFKEQEGDEKLVQESGRIRDRIDTITTLHEKSLQLADDEVAAGKKSEDCRKAVNKLSGEQKKVANKLDTAEKLLDRLTRERKMLLADKDGASLQRELFQNQNRQKSVQELLLLLEKSGRQSQRENEAAKSLSKVNGQAEEAEKTLLKISKEIKEKKQAVKLLDERLRLLAHIRDLEEERQHLHDNAPCPLCGSTSHPYRRSTPPELSCDERELQEARSKLEELETEERKWSHRKIACAEQQKSLTRELQELTAVLGQREKEREQLLSQLDLPPLAQLQEGQLHEEEERLLSLTKTLQQRYDGQEKLKKELNLAQEQSKALSLTAQNLDRELLAAEHLAAAALQEEKGLLATGKEFSDNLAEQARQLSHMLAPYGIKECGVDQLPAIQGTLERRAENWKKKKEEESSVSTTLLSLDSELNHRQNDLRKKNATLEGQERICNGLKQELSDLEQHRFNLFGQKDTLQESEQLERKVKECRKEFGSSQAKREKTASQLTAATTLLARLKEEQEGHSLQLDKQEKVLNKSLHSSPFSDLQQFLAARLTAEELAELEKVADELKKKRISLETLIRDKKATLAREKEKKLSSEQTKSLEGQIEEREKELEQLQEQTGAAREQLLQNDRDRQRSAAGLKEITNQQQRLGRWNRLHMLIGSADGKKFRNFAQGLTFEMMVNHANSHLSRMSERYILVRDRMQPLDLNVIDTWQAGEIRSTRNLSGGESFLVSLALALGLSRMASQNVRVDSLFLDEGFGTLDEEALESALDALSGLREEGKLIGIISHVAALKDRIPVQIEVTPGSGGKSRVSGPGVSHQHQGK